MVFGSFGYFPLPTRRCLWYLSLHMVQYRARRGQTPALTENCRAIPPLVGSKHEPMEILYDPVNSSLTHLQEENSAIQSGVNSSRSLFPSERHSRGCS